MNPESRGVDPGLVFPYFGTGYAIIFLLRRNTFTKLLIKDNLHEWGYVKSPLHNNTLHS